MRRASLKICAAIWNGGRGDLFSPHQFDLRENTDVG
jgi:hypothetical protein